MKYHRPYQNFVDIALPNQLISVLLLLSLATNSEAGCRAYCKDTEILCLKSAHKRNWQMKWGRELAKQAQQAAQRAVNGNDKGM